MAISKIKDFINSKDYSDDATRLKMSNRKDIAEKIAMKNAALKKLDTVTTIADLKIFIAALINEEI